MSETIKILQASMPNFHGSDDEPKNWKSQWDILEYLDATLKPGMKSLETGCGYSSVVAASSGADHTTVTPSIDETERVKKFCDEAGINRENLSFDIGPSYAVLAKGGSELDLVYIDGAHGFPHPCVDWMHTEARLTVGGTLLVDDIRIPTCRMLHDFLLEEKNWKLERLIGDTSIFTKTGLTQNNADWMGQGANASYPDFSFLPAHSRAAKKSRHLAERTLATLGLTKPVKRLLGIK